MLVLGLLLILGAALITVGAIFDAGETATVEILGQTITTTAAGVFIAGMVTMLMFLIGVWAISASMGRARRKRAERKDAKRSHKESVRQLEEERAALREENERLSRQLSSGAPAGPTAGAGAGATAGAADTTRLSPSDTTQDHADHTTNNHVGHDDHTQHTGARGLVDRVTGRSHEPTSPESADSRIIDHNTDLTTQESSSTGRHRDAP